MRSVYKHHDGNKYFKRKINQNPEVRIFETSVFDEPNGKIERWTISASTEGFLKSDIMNTLSKKSWLHVKKSVIDEWSFLNATTSNPVTHFDYFYSVLSESVKKNHFTVAYHYWSMSVVLKTHHLGNYRNWIYSIECSRYCLIFEMRYACSF